MFKKPEKVRHIGGIDKKIKTFMEKKNNKIFWEMSIITFTLVITIWLNELSIIPSKIYSNLFFFFLEKTDANVWNQFMVTSSRLTPIPKSTNNWVFQPLYGQLPVVKGKVYSFSSKLSKKYIKRLSSKPFCVSCPQMSHANQEESLSPIRIRPKTLWREQKATTTTP